MARFSRAIRAHEAFSGHTPGKVRVSKLPDRDVTGWQMGPVLGIAYEAKRDGKTQPYFHEFAKPVRPKLVSRDDGRQLYIDGGSYIVTDHGIEDMPKLFTVNPSPRRKAKPMAARRRKRSSARRRATRQVAIFSANPARRRRRRRITRARRRSFLGNPAPRRAGRRRSTVRRYRRNPSARGLGGSFAKLLMPAAGIGLGAIGTEILMGQLPIPAAWKVGVARHVTKGAVGVAAGWAIGKVLRQKRLGMYFSLGAIAIAVHDGVKEVLAAKMPNLAMGYYSPGMITGPMGEYLPSGVGADVNATEFRFAA